jgi:hypothetical protein
LREGHRSRAFENRVLRGVFGAKVDEVRGTGENVMSSLSKFILFIKLY